MVNNMAYTKGACNTLCFDKLYLYNNYYNNTL